MLKHIEQSQDAVKKAKQLAIYRAIQSLRAALADMRVAGLRNTHEYAQVKYSLADMRRTQKHRPATLATCRILLKLGDKVARTLCKKFPVNLKNPDNSRFTAYINEPIEGQREVIIYDHAKKKQLFKLEPGFKLYHSAHFILKAQVVRTSGCGKVYRVKILESDMLVSSPKAKTPALRTRTRIAIQLPDHSEMIVMQTNTTADEALGYMTELFTDRFISRADCELSETM